MLHLSPSGGCVLQAAGVELVGAAISEAELRFGPREMAEIELDPQVGAVVFGFDPATCYFHIAFAVRCLLELDCSFVVTNRDYQYPSANGTRLPGNGAFVAAVAAAARREPDLVVAKPSPMILEAITRNEAVSADRILMVGDMWSDIAFGHRAGAAAALVLSGVASAAEASTWTGDSRPDILLRDVRGLISPAHVIASDANTARHVGRIGSRQPFNAKSGLRWGCGAALALAAAAVVSASAFATQRSARS